jgi:tetratricopeptide (TPR) repeat protein
MMRGFLSVALCLGLVLPSIGAEKGRPLALDRLFAELHRTKNQSEANRLTSLIWQIWNNPEDAETSRLMDDGRDALQRLDFGTALNRFNAIIARAPTLAEGWNKRATLFYVMGDYGASIRDIDRVLDLEPRHFGALAGLGMNYDALGNKRKALDAWRQALVANPHLLDAPIRIRELETLLQEKGI